MTIAIYALSGDPITYGHIDIIERASKAFEKLIVAIGENPAKKYTLNSIERLNVAKQSLSHIENIEICIFDGLLADFAFENKADFIIRGVRDSKDVSDEQSLASINASQSMVDTFLLFSKSKFAHVSSSSVKALQKENGCISEYVPLPVKKIIEKKISDQTILGITGIMGSGKSYVAEKLVFYSQMIRESCDNAEEYPLVHNIELDKLAHIIYDSSIPAYQSVRDKIFNHFNTLDRKKISEITFGGDEKSNKIHVDFLNNVFKDPIRILLRKELRGKKGIILINSALLAEQNFLNDCNNNVILVSAKDEIRHERLSNFRKIDPKIAEKRISFMLSNKEKKSLISEKIKNDRFGEIIHFENNEVDIENIERLYEKIIKI